MQNSGVLTQILGVVAIAGGGLFGALSFANGGVGLVIGGLIVGGLLICVGNAFYALGDIAKDAKRSADALERLTKR